MRASLRPLITEKAALLLLCLGLLQLGGEWLHWPLLKGLGLASAAAPAPQVFTAVQGFETYSVRYQLRWKDLRGRERSLRLTPQTAARLRGPYNRRNVYGAVLAYGPLLASNPKTQALFSSVSSFGLCGRAPLLNELGADPAGITGPVTIHYQSSRKGGLAGLPARLEVDCP